MIDFVSLNPGGKIALWDDIRNELVCASNNAEDLAEVIKACGGLIEPVWTSSAWAEPCEWGFESADARDALWDDVLSFL